MGVMLSRALSIILMILGSSYPSRADQCFALHLNSQTRIKISSDFLESDKIDLLRIIEGIDKILSSLERPQVEILPVAEVGDAYQLNGKIGVTLRQGQDSRKMSLAVFAHEYAHAYFATGFKLPFEGQYLTQEQIVERLKQTAEKVYGDLREPELWKKWQDQIKLKNEEATQQAKTDWENAITRGVRLLAPLESLYRNYSHIILPYNELFADLIAVSLFGKASVIADALGIPKVYPFIGFDSEALLKRHSAQYRKDFDLALRPRDFSQNIDVRDFVPDPDLMHYTLLDPTRSYVYRKYKEYITGAKGGSFAKAYLEATQEHTQRRVKRFGTDGKSNESPRQINREFIFHLRKALSGNGLAP